MSSVYVPGSFKKKKEDDTLVEKRIIPAKIEVKEIKKWVTEKEPVEKKKEIEKEDVISYPRQNVYLRKKELEEFMQDEEMQDIYEQFLSYDNRFLDKLRDNENGYYIFSKFIYLNFKDKTRLKKM